MPFVSRGHGAVNAGMNPVAGCVAPNVPLASGDVALRPEDPAPVPVGLVAVKFKRLGVLGRGQVEVDVVLKVVSTVSSAELLPPQCIGIGVAAGNGENSG